MAGKYFNGLGWLSNVAQTALATALSLFTSSSAGSTYIAGVGVETQVSAARDLTALGGTPTPPAPSFTMPKLAAALNATKANTADTYWGSEGDSVHMGRGAGTGSVGTDGARPLAITGQFASRMKALGYPVRQDAFFGSGLVDSITQYNAYNAMATVDTATWTLGSNTAGGAMFVKASATAGPFSYAATDAWDTVDIYTPSGPSYPGTLVAKIDGGTATNIVLGGSAAVKKTTLAAASLATHTITLDSLDANQVGILGMVFRKAATKQMIVINLAARGWTASTWADTSSPWSPANMAGAIGLHGADYSLGINDFRDNSTLTQAAFQASIATNLAKLTPTADVIMFSPTDIAPGDNTGTFTMTQLDTVYQQYAASNGYGFVDAIAVVGNYAAVNGAGNMYDNLHAKAPVYATLGLAMAVYVDAATRAAGYVPVIAALGLSGTPGAATTGTAYGFTPVTTGGVSPYTYSISAGALPAGISLNTATGALSGTPTTVGTSSFTIRVTDSQGTPATATLATSITVSAAATNAFQDSFTAADGTALASHTSDTGHTWATPATPWTIYSNRVVGGNASATIAAQSSYKATDVAVEADYTFVTAINQGVFLAARGTDQANGIIAGYRASVGGWTIINFSTANFVTQLGSVVPYTPAAGDTHHVRLECKGQVYKLYIDGTLVITATDTSSALQTTGFIGMGDFTGASTATAGIAIDNLVANPI